MRNIISSKIKWHLVIIGVAITSFLISISTFRLNDIQSGLRFYVTVFVAILILAVWRMQSTRIVLYYDAISFERILFRNHKIYFNDLVSIQYHLPDKKTKFLEKASFIEVDTKSRYFSYYIDHFNLEEVKNCLETVSREQDILLK